MRICAKKGKRNCDVKRKWQKKKKNGEHKTQINSYVNKNEIYFWSNLSGKSFVLFYYTSSRFSFEHIFLLFSFLCVQFKCLVEIDDGEN